MPRCGLKFPAVRLCCSACCHAGGHELCHEHSAPEFVGCCECVLMVNCLGMQTTSELHERRQGGISNVPVSRHHGNSNSISRACSGGGSGHHCSCTEQRRRRLRAPWRCQPQLPASLPARVLASAASAQQPYSAVSAVTLARSDEVQRMTQYLSSDLVPGGLRTVSCGFCPNLPEAVRLYTVDCVLRVSCATLHGLLGCGLLTGQMAALCYGSD